MYFKKDIGEDCWFYERIAKVNMASEVLMQSN